MAGATTPAVQVTVVVSVVMPARLSVTLMVRAFDPDLRSDTARSTLKLFGLVRRRTSGPSCMVVHGPPLRRYWTLEMPCGSVTVPWTFTHR